MSKGWIHQLRGRSVQEPGHRGRLCSGCKTSRARLESGRSRSAQRLAWSRAFEFTLFSRRVNAPKYWCDWPR